MLEIGLKGTKEVLVDTHNDAIHVGSGDVPVFATPAMISLMEDTAASSVRPFLQEGDATVGISIQVTHSSATPHGMTVHCESVLTEIDRKRLVFTVRAFDDAGLIGEGTHERFIINKEKFMEKASAKSEHPSAKKLTE